MDRSLPGFWKASRNHLLSNERVIERDEAETARLAMLILHDNMVLDIAKPVVKVAVRCPTSTAVSLSPLSLFLGRAALDEKS